MTDETQKQTEEETKEEETPATEEAPKEEASAPQTADEQSADDTKDTDSDESEEVEVPEQFKKIVEQVEQMSVMELNELVKVLEKRFGVSAQAVAAAPAGGGEAAEEAQSTFTVELAAVGGQKVAVIKVVKEVLGLGLKDAKDLVEGAPATVKEGVEKAEADELKAKLEEAGATVEVK